MNDSDQRAPSLRQEQDVYDEFVRTHPKAHLAPAAKSRELHFAVDRMITELNQ